jgi:rhodanese-related sulfurtransferase
MPTAAIRRDLRCRIAAVIAACCLWAASPAAHAQEVVTAPQAWAMAEDGGLVIVDVRTHPEWLETGTAPGAHRISLYDNWGVPNEEFLDKVLAAVGGEHDRPVALICASGARSAYAAGVLREAGFTSVVNISEGMVGNGEAVGWLSRALPVEDCGECPPG